MFRLTNWKLALAALVLSSVTTPAFAGSWITHPEAAGTAARKTVSLQFRREIAFAKAPARALVRVSADNRYILYANGKRVAAGPSRGDLQHWRARSIDLAPFLRRGTNVISALVWNDGPAAPAVQVSARTGFLLLSIDPELADLDTGTGWRVRIDRSRSVAAGPPHMARMVKIGPYYAAAPPETHDAAAQQPDWLAPVTRGDDWTAAVAAVGSDEAAPWTLVEDRLPPMEYLRLDGGAVVRAEGVAAARFPRGPTVIPANSIATLLIDAGKVQAAYPMLEVGGGRGAEVTLTYTEALYGPDKKYLRNRAQVSGGKALGLTDTFRPDGSAETIFQPYWWRVWRFVEIRIKTASEPLELKRLDRIATGYPFARRGRFVSSDAELNRIWSIGWDTLRLDAHETFMDTAYWEQLQYVGDTRIEALLSYAVAGDPRLAVQAIEAIDDSRSEGLPQSRWPSSIRQSIPPFALLWIGMLHDYWGQQPDLAPLRRSLSGMRSVLAWYGNYVGSDGLVGTTPGWEFIDWRPTLNNYPQTTNARNSEPCIITLMYIGALKQSADLEDAVGEPSRASVAREQAARLAQAVQDRCWSPERGLYADTPEKLAYSQHANILAVIYDVAPKAAQIGIIDRITVRDGGIAPPAGVTGTTYYFAFYLARALEHAGLSDRYVELLRTWRGMLGQNFTTWPEEPDPTRSDSHAWSAHPTADLLAIVAGIQSAAPGFQRVKIAPHLGSLDLLDAAMAHPAGLIEVSYRRAGRRLRVMVRLPASLSGEFVLEGKRIPLRGGRNAFILEGEISGRRMETKPTRPGSGPSPQRPASLAQAAAPASSFTNGSVNGRD